MASTHLKSHSQRPHLGLPQASRSLPSRMMYITHTVIQYSHSARGPLPGGTRSRTGSSLPRWPAAWRLVWPHRPPPQMATSTLRRGCQQTGAPRRRPLGREAGRTYCANRRGHQHTHYFEFLVAHAHVHIQSRTKGLYLVPRGEGLVLRPVFEGGQVEQAHLAASGKGCIHTRRHGQDDGCRGAVGQVRFRSAEYAQSQIHERENNKNRRKQ